VKNESEQKNRSAGKLIGELSRAAHIYFHSSFREQSIGHAQVRSLLFIARNEGISQLELAEYLRLDKSSVTSQLKILERNGYIVRKPSEEDARRLQLEITEKTKEILEPIRQVYSSWTEILLDGFSEEERSESLNYLERMRDNVHSRLDLNKHAHCCRHGESSDPEK